ncbi:MAG: sigma-54 dependent transcriptional regulator [Marinilabiliales bacterium]|nr:sigma-54 dependent transcriptional regulator [Marinilabiliales bacterium]
MDIQEIKQRFSIIGNAPGLNRAIEVALQVAPTDLSVLVTGESGVGKESFPQIIHYHSHRKHGKYIAINCGAIPEGTIDSELFGHEKGSFTGALNDRKGYFEVTDGGTLFLDEIGELPTSTQVRLLRVLETGEFIRVGSSQVQKTNVRVIAATNFDLTNAIREGKFREDLYYRLNTVPIKVLPLRERGNDVLLLFRKFASDFAERYKMPSIRLNEDAQRIFLGYRWPGNVRQLKNITEQISIIETDRDITAEKLVHYIPNEETGFLPALYQNEADARAHENERTMMLNALIGLKKELDELKEKLNQLSKSPGTKLHPAHEEEGYMQLFHENEGIEPENQLITAGFRKGAPAGHIQDTEEFVEESLSLEEKEMELIFKALERHNGKRKLAAEELGISERTLYRKIKEYNLTQKQ